MFRGAVRGDLPQILQIYAHAREAMAASGNPTQWGDNFPPQELLEEDIDSNRLFVSTASCWACSLSFWGRTPPIR